MTCDNEYTTVASTIHNTIAIAIVLVLQSFSESPWFCSDIQIHNTERERYAIQEIFFVWQKGIIGLASFML